MKQIVVVAALILVLCLFDPVVGRRSALKQRRRARQDVVVGNDFGNNIKICNGVGQDITFSWTCFGVAGVPATIQDQSCGLVDNCPITSGTTNTGVYQVSAAAGALTTTLTTTPNVNKYGFYADAAGTLQYYVCTPRLRGIKQCGMN